MAKKDPFSLPELEALPLSDEEESRQFVMRVDGHRVRMEYDRNGDRIFLTHVDVPVAIAGHGIDEVITVKVLTWTEQNNLSLVPSCTFVKEFLRKNPEWQRLMLKGVQL
ncbi:MAG: N-acetyltransferase [Flavobacteriales bacterium]|nr:N-acetyltransferase [Flavobacteriales bacterium]MBK6944342.1 N-acetyltransferase [Flavobacteriales bacterium]MBK7242114.1 N-acetyltransferase [Flavobacteriales bacterium]MBK9534009.1 N-acetyltransferase [Flavobacteriales bacterium]MBP9137523.1 N-acetyltransferase [Flavobacteriales bacterium]